MRSPAHPFSAPWRLDRLPAILICIACATPLFIAAALSPDPAGTGTHTQLGLAPCSFKVVTGLPCATCGMTTAFTHAAHGDFVSAWLVQPAGTVIAVLSAMASLVCGYAAVTGATLEPLGRALWRPRTILALVGLVILGWLYTLAVTLGT